MGICEALASTPVRCHRREGPPADRDQDPPAQRLDGKDFRTHLGIRTTSPARTILDCAPILEKKTLRRVVNDGLRTPFPYLPSLTETLGRFPRHPGATLLTPILVDAARGLTDSTFEDDFLAFCRANGLPIPETNVRIAGHRVDALFREAKLIVECDGWEYHKDKDAFEKDRDRDADTLPAGYATIRVTKRRIEHTPEREARRLASILEARTR